MSHWKRRSRCRRLSRQQYCPEDHRVISHRPHPSPAEQGYRLNRDTVATCCTGPPFQDSDEIHLYLLSLTSLAAACERRAALALLDDREREALARIRAPGRELEYLFGRWAVRTLLGHYLDLPPGAVALLPDERGKPQVAAPVASPPGLNLSHSGDLLAVALCATGEVGVDVERLDEALANQVEAIAVRHFLPTEQAALTALTGADRLAAFYRLWTLKEAVLKSTGTGLQVPLDRVDVAQVQSRYRIQWHHEGRTFSVEARHWEGPWPGYQLALARPGRLGAVRFGHTLPGVRPATDRSDGR